MGISHVISVFAGMFVIAGAMIIGDATTPLAGSAFGMIAGMAVGMVAMLVH